jgi:glutamine amidotransferase-like uncharacterized protein
VSRRALVYRGPASDEDCPAALADLLRSSAWGFEVAYVGPHSELELSPATLAGAALYAQPGGGDSVQRAYRHVRCDTETIRAYVGSGGRYLGICMGGYLAGHWRGHRLLPADTDQYITSAGATVTTAADTLVEVDWRGRRHRMFFQDGPVFRLPAARAEATVLARYAGNGEIAALVTPFGRGRVGVCGPHPEAPDDWYEAHGLPVERSTAAPLGRDLVDVLMSS